MRRGAIAGLAAMLALSSTLAPRQALAWGSTGHRLVGVAAMQALPTDLPLFIRSPAGAASVGELSREQDRSKGAGKAHDANRDPGHYVDLDDAGRILGGPTLGALPPNRAEYEKALQAAGADSWKAGYLPYSIVETWQQLTLDLGYWRVLRAAESRTRDAKRRAWYTEDRRRREAQILRDLGDLSHFVGDGAQPLHMSVHYNGWGAFPNPEGFTTARIHSPIEGVFVRQAASLASVSGAMVPSKSCGCAIEQRVARYLSASGEYVLPLYRLEKAGGFKPGDRRGQAFVIERLGVGASELRDLTVEAWKASAGIEVGWPAVKVADVLSGAVDPYDALTGVD